MRSVNDAERQPSNAKLAAVTAVSTSAADANATRLLTRPVAGSNTSPVRPDGPANAFPLIQWDTRGGSPVVMHRSFARPFGDVPG